MIQATARRFTTPHAGLQFLNPMVIGSADHGALIRQQLSDVGITPSAVVLEPIGRNTAATALLAAEIGAEIDAEALVLLLPADHRIANPSAFLTAIARAAPTARDRIVTFGIEPGGPDTAYGYVQCGDVLDHGVFAIARFHEKPTRAAAEDMLARGGFFWNAGIFFFQPSVVREAFALAPVIRESVQAALRETTRDGVTWRLPNALFALTPSAPFDVAIMEKTNRSAVAPCDIGWADVGSFAELWRLSDKDEHGNVIIGAAVLHDCTDCLVISTGVPIAMKGLRASAIIATDHGVLVLPLDEAQAVKTLHGDLKARGLA